MWITKFFNDIRDWRETRRTLREVRASAKADTETLLRDPDRNPVDLAELALREDNRTRAVQHWNDAFVRFPDHVEKSHKAARLAVDLGLLDQAEALAAKGQKRLPPDAFWFELGAEMIHRRGDISAALNSWNSVRSKFPDRTLAYVKVAACLDDLGREDELLPFLNDAIKRFPDVFDCRIVYARLAERHAQWTAALEQWAWMEEHVPGIVEGVLGVARVLDQLGRPDEAEARLRALRHRHPTSPDVAIALARHAMRRSAWDEAAGAWENIRIRWPERQEGYHGGADALIALGRHAEAEQLRAASP